MTISYKNKMKRPIWIMRLLVLLFFLVFLFINNNYLKLNNVDINKNGEPMLTESFKVLQISDLHGKVFSSKQNKLKLIFDRTDYDIVVMTGDIIDKNTKEFRAIKPLFEYFKEHNKQVLFITGNHEGANKLYNTEFKKLMDDNNVILLDNDSYTLQLANQQRNITFVGLSDPNVTAYSDSQAQVNDYLETANTANDVTILLAHRPTFIHEFKGKTDIMLSGHAHGGQIRLPFIGGLISPDQGWFPKYDYGVYVEQDETTNNSTYLYVSKGLGNSVIPFRLFNVPEVALITIK